MLFILFNPERRFCQRKSFAIKCRTAFGLSRCLKIGIPLFGGAWTRALGKCSKPVAADSLENSEPIVVRTRDERRPG